MIYHSSGTLGAGTWAAVCPQCAWFKATSKDPDTLAARLAEHEAIHHEAHVPGLPCEIVTVGAVSL